MNNGIILFSTFIITAIIAVIFYYLFSLRKKRHSQTIVSDWNKFNKAILNKHLKGVDDFGRKLIFNEYLDINKLNEMSELIYDLDKNYEELKELKILIFNKHLNWNKDNTH
tara:strand:+ start:37322 stop:37654 length:333 start_codon:yes stop_codon:yes gene_type:complete